MRRIECLFLFSAAVLLTPLQFRSFADVQTAEMLNLPRPRLESGKPIVIACPMSEEQAALQDDLVKRYERIRSTKVDPREDNALNITTDGRKLALDGRMLSGGARDFPGSKINGLVENVARIWKQTSDRRLTQMIFCDMGVNPTAWGFSAYEEVIEKLIRAGILAQEIAVIGDADSDAKKAALFAKVRSGQVRVLIGSTKKMGTGTNVQKRLVALHHLDAPWKPAEIEQREGRILRQGNGNEEVAIYRYVTQGSFDSYMWQTLETKARFINQVMTGDNTLRRAEDVGSQELSYAEVKAIASGNPAVLTLAEADAEIQRLAILKKNHADEQYLTRRSLRELPERIDYLTRRLAGLSDDIATMSTQAGRNLIIGDRFAASDEALEALAQCMEGLPRHVMQIRRMPLGVYRGLSFGVILHPQFAPEVYLEGSITRQDRLSREHHGPRAVLNAVERLADSYAGARDSVRQELAIAQAQLRDFQARFGQEFVHADYLARLTGLRDQLKAGLSSDAPQEGTPGAAELAERIKELRAGNSSIIEATSERTAKRKVSAEEPVTSRILRKAAEEVPPVAVEVQSITGEAATRMADRIKRAAGLSR